jgi:hypothetical protein
MRAVNKRVEKNSPWKATSRSSIVGLVGFDLRREYIDITMPGVQNPH